MPLPLLALIGCYPSDVGWLNIILFMIGSLLGQFSTCVNIRHPLGIRLWRNIAKGAKNRLGPGCWMLQSIKVFNIHNHNS